MNTNGAVWTLAEQFEGKLKGVSFELLSRGRMLADKLGVTLVSVLIGNGVGDSSLEELIRRGPTRYTRCRILRWGIFPARFTRRFWRTS
jgi:hypothetical protein